MAEVAGTAVAGATERSRARRVPAVTDQGPVTTCRHRVEPTTSPHDRDPRPPYFPDFPGSRAYHVPVGSRDVQDSNLCQGSRMSMSSKTTPLGRPRGTLGARRGDLRRRLLVHHLPLAVVSALVLFLFISLPPFLNSSSAGDVSSDQFPKSHEQGTQGMTHGGGQPMTHGDSQGQPMNMPMPGGPGPTKATRNFLEQLSISTGYLALGFVGLTLLIGSLNLLLRRRSLVSSYVRRDIGMWAAVAIVAHVIVVGLLTISTDRSLRELKAKRWKSLQRLNYVLFAMSVLHAFFYGALLRATSPFTLVLFFIAGAVFAAQAIGIWLWRRRHARTPGQRADLDETESTSTADRPTLL